ncbi:MAG: cytochrome c3 family protein [Candidatus Marinimicrobia bacterium]|nr:cytochrome c3 family protein [Candidatus Neomarinimicrobiota bacterium]
MTPERNQQIKWISITFLVISLALIMRDSRWRLVGNHQGYQPAQPIEFSHRLHAGELEVPCQYCHSSAATSKLAGIPSTGLCMNCHKFVPAPLDQIRLADAVALQAGLMPKPVVSGEIAKIYRDQGLGPDLKPLKSPSHKSLAWIKVHNLPDFVFFNHAPHIAADVDCSKCHGDVAAMERITQVETLGMGWCLDCHRSVERPESIIEQTPDISDCSVCHY